MKIGLFTDSHYSSTESLYGRRENNKSLKKIKEAYDFFMREKCDLVVCLGDLIDCENDHEKEIANLQEIARVMDNYDVRTQVVMGNHDAFCFFVDEFYSILGKNRQPDNIYFDGKALIFLDACYTKDGKHYSPPGGDWTDTYLPNLTDLETILNKPEIQEACIFLHQNVDSEIMKEQCIHNIKEFCSLIEKSGKVKAVYQGHYHLGMETVKNGILYKAFLAVCEYENAYFVIEF